MDVEIPTNLVKTQSWGAEGKDFKWKNKLGYMSGSRMSFMCFRERNESMAVGYHMWGENEKR